MDKAIIFVVIFVLLVLIFGTLLATGKLKGIYGGQEAAAAEPPKKHHLIKTVAKTGLMVAPLALLAL